MTILISRDTLHSICSGPVGTSAAIKGSDNDGMQLKTICGHVSKTNNTLFKAGGGGGGGGLPSLRSLL